MIFLFPRWDTLVPLMAFFLLFEYSVVVFPQVFCALEASPRESWNIIGILGPWRLCHLAATWWYYWWWPNPVLVDWSLRLFAKLQNTILYIPDARFDQHQHFKRFSMCTVNSQVLVSTAHPSLTCQAQWSESETQISSSKLWLNCFCWTPPYHFGRKCALAFSFNSFVSWGLLKRFEQLMWVAQLRQRWHNIIPNLRSSEARNLKKNLLIQWSPIFNIIYCIYMLYIHMYTYIYISVYDIHMYIL